MFLSEPSTSTETRRYHKFHQFQQTPVCLTVSPVALGVETLPGVSATGSGLVVSVTLVDTTRFLAGGSEATRFAVLSRRPVSAIFQACIATLFLVRMHTL